MTGPTWEIRQGDALELIRAFSDDVVDAVITDPPYGIGFMGKEWDGRAISAAAMRDRDTRSNLGPESSEADGRLHGGSTSAFGNAAVIAGPRTAGPNFQAWCESWSSECLRVLKPGGYLLAFGGARTYHRLVCGVEDAGFEIRDQLAWLFGSGFPKSRNLAGGLGTALKPGHEPVVLARKPMVGPLAVNVEQYGTGALNIDRCRIALADPEEYQRNHSGDRGHGGTRSIEDRGATDLRMGGGTAAGARWPSNVMLDEEAAAMVDEQSGELVSGANPTRRHGDFSGQDECDPARGLDIGGASRFFYCAKASRAERNRGLSGFPPKALNWSSGDESPGTFQSEGTERRVANHHPTVKPIELMRWLARLVAPAGGTILDPFAGSGTTGIAALREGFSFIGIEREAEYVAIARARIAGAAPLLNHGAEVVA